MVKIVKVVEVVKIVKIVNNKSDLSDARGPPLVPKWQLPFGGGTQMAGGKYAYQTLLNRRAKRAEKNIDVFSRLFLANDREFLDEH